MSIDLNLTTDRLRLRPWRDSDFAAFAALNADPRVMEYFPNTLSRDESDAKCVRIKQHFDRRGFGMWAVEAVGVADFIGVTGLVVPDFDLPFTPCIEVGWRLAYEHWGRGYATEAARAAVDYGFSELHADEIVAYTVPHNRRSRRVMEKLGMTRSPAEDFDHPKVDEGHPLRRCVLYRLARAAWKMKRSA